MHNDSHSKGHSGHSRPYLMLGVNMALSLIVMYVVMFTMTEPRRQRFSSPPEAGGPLAVAQLTKL
ncbi:hypothetical protein [Aliihoeflea sp. 40Bstr573]|uniref:hypothetical protein n=1 Tax=Aliihoeflea sp. 40Bstr573 TaxID=2696467 RepID=UPI002095AC70|nr:hypothetical protein [Aliihoeflea sp. 40Bstr573]MCO6386680.1 hypothetical protein [Aliihoeflea sp. 40Bstr573]